jgi:hypothetical protein
MVSLSSSAWIERVRHVLAVRKRDAVTICRATPNEPRTARRSDHGRELKLTSSGSAPQLNTYFRARCLSVVQGLDIHPRTHCL